MWTVVHFIKEDAVEAVPSHWIKKGMCEWPKKDIKKHIYQKTIVNKFDFNYFPARILKKGIGNFIIFIYIVCMYCEVKILS